MAVSVNPNTSIYNSVVNSANNMGSGVSLQEMGMLVHMERHRILEGQVRDQFGDMQKKNAWLADATHQLSQLRSVPRPTDDKKFPLSSIQIGDGKGGTDGTGPKNLEQWFVKNGIEYPPRTMNAADLDSTIQNLKSAIDTANSNSQMDMITLQGTMDKTQQESTFLTNWEAKGSKLMESILQNIR